MNGDWTDSWGDKAASSGYTYTGAALKFGGGVAKTVGGVIDVTGSLANLGRASSAVSDRISYETGSNTMGVLAGAGYYGGSFVGLT